MEKKLIAFNGYSFHMDTIKDIVYLKKKKRYHIQMDTIKDILYQKKVIK